MMIKPSVFNSAAYVAYAEVTDFGVNDKADYSQRIRSKGITCLAMKEAVLKAFGDLEFPYFI